MAQMELPPTLEDSAAVGASPRAAEGAADPYPYPYHYPSPSP